MTIDRQSGIHVELEAAVRVHMLPDQRGQGSQIPGREPFRPLRLRQHLLQHEGVDVNHAILEQVQCEHGQFLVFQLVGTEFPMATVVDKIGR